MTTPRGRRTSSASCGPPARASSSRPSRCSSALCWPSLPSSASPPRAERVYPSPCQTFCSLPTGGKRGCECQASKVVGGDTHARAPQAVSASTPSPTRGSWPRCDNKATFLNSPSSPAGPAPLVTRPDARSIPSPLYVVSIPPRPPPFLSLLSGSNDCFNPTLSTTRRNSSLPGHLTSDSFADGLTPFPPSSHY